MKKIRTANDGYSLVWCPGCGHAHAFTVKPGGWTLEGTPERPTVSPSLLVDKDMPERRCHFFIRDGKIQYLSDCHHKLKNQTVEMVDF